MNQKIFINNMIDAFNGTVEELTLDTNYRDLAEWDSLASVSTVAMIYAEYDVQVSGDELLACNSLGDLLNIVQEKQAEKS